MINLLLKKKKLIRSIAWGLSFTLLSELCLPSISYALTSGPDSPEFSSFEPVATTDMVNLFSGDFIYNLPVIEIPGSDGGGYALSLSYHSGTMAEEEASWVGYGWTLNPGAINRQVRGFPDDYKQAPVQQYNKTRPNVSASITSSVGLEALSQKRVEKNTQNDKKDTTLFVNVSDASFNINSTVRFNNYQGFARYNGFGINAKGLANLQQQRGAQGVTYSAGVNFAGIFQRIYSKRYARIKQGEKSYKVAFDQKTSFMAKALTKILSGIRQNYGSTYGIYSFNNQVRSTSLPQAKGKSFNWSTGLLTSVTPNNIGVSAGLRGNVTAKANHPYTLLKANGYLHNPNNISSEELSDYYVEKDFPYQKRNLFLGIPFNNADNYVLSGEGLSGSFKFFPRRVGQFYPNAVENTTQIRQVGLDFSLGASVGVGADFGIGMQKSTVNKWRNEGNTNSSIHQFDNTGAFRFKNDMAGSVTYGNSKLSTARLARRTSVSANVNDTLQVEGNQFSNSSYVEYHDVNYARNNNETNFFNKLLSKDQINSVGVDGNSIAEVSIYNADGTNHVYGQPVYNRNEASLQFDVTASTDQIENRYLAYKNIPLYQDPTSQEFKANVKDNNTSTIVGDVKTSPYATNYLLTQIFSYDYVDVNQDGPDEKDFGGWTQFYYHQKYGSNSEWYRWRTPYNGLLYSQNQISDTQDDVGAVHTGEKEIYYLKAVETKTHIAFFVTNKSDKNRFSQFNQYEIPDKYLQGSGSTRKDGMDSEPLTSLTDPAASNVESRGSKDLEYLEKIVLFHKDRPDVPIKTVCFQYDYSMVQNLPNSADGNYPNPRVNNGESGKLTLKKVWFEYEGIKNARISPYEFEYKYKNYESFASNVQNKYGDKLKANDTYSDAAQNPDYQPDALDPWGCIQFDGRNRKQNMQPWLSQKILSPDETKSFDPAAWQLKQITLPSGGQILIEYEQKDYAFVQDRAPMAMASLHQAFDYPEGVPIKPRYQVNVADLGIDPTDILSIDRQIEKLKTYFAEEKMYFKFLYKLVGEGLPTLDDCRSEYISGYAEADTNHIQRVTLEDGSYAIEIGLVANGNNDQRTLTPRQACYDYYTTQALGKSRGSDCLTSIEYNNSEIFSDIQPGSLSAGKVIKLMGLMSAALANPEYNIPGKALIGKQLNPELSYLKLPMINAKRGGGVRVKRLMMYDPGLEKGDAVLYGQEYKYEDYVEREDGSVEVISSGVASNEPPPAREENPLVTFLPREQQSWFSRITTGEDREQSEGPLGESILPAASIGHSRVVVESIHKGKTGTGFTIHEFFTCKDYPFDGLYRVNQNGVFNSDIEDENLAYVSGVEKTSLASNQATRSFSIPAGFFFFEQSKSWMSQGFRFLKNMMHGQIKRVATFSGDYNAGNIENAAKVSEQVYEYYQPGEKVKMLQPDGSFTYDLPGKEMDVAREAKSVREKTIDFAIDVDIAIATFFPFNITTTAALAFSLSNKGISTHTTSKVVCYPTILKKVTAFQDGVTSTTEHLAFNPHTGQSMLTRTEDGFDRLNIKNNASGTHDGSIYSLNLPASWYYPEMRAKFLANNVQANNTNQLSAQIGGIVSYGAAGNPLDTTNNQWSIPDNVISASLQTFKKDWLNSGSPYYDLLSASYQTNPQSETELNKFWRPEKSYIYRDNIQSANQNNGNIRTGGTMSQITFPTETDWAANEPMLDDKWILQNQIVQYSPNGNPIEEENVLEIPSAAKFGYGNLLPTMVAANAHYTSIYFEDYENMDIPQISDEAHSGSKSLSFTVQDSNTPIIPGIVSDSILVPTNANDSSLIGGARLFMWIKSESDVALQIDLNGNTLDLERLARTGDWALYHVMIAPEVFPNPGSTFDIDLLYNGSEKIYIDDVKFQPSDAQATCYVYDVATFRLITQFDDQHYGLYYQYDAEGKLTRKLIETERGLKTVTETQYNIKKKYRE